MISLAGIMAALMFSAASSAGQAQLEASEQEILETQFRAPMRAHFEALHAEYQYRWFEVSRHGAVQFGHPEGGAHITILCDEGRIGIMGDALTTADVGFSFRVRFANGEQRTATLIDAFGPIDLGDGPIFLVEMTPDDPLLAWMLRQTRIEMEDVNLFDETRVFISVPTAGGLELLRSLIDDCRR